MTVVQLIKVSDEMLDHPMMPQALKHDMQIFKKRQKGKKLLSPVVTIGQDGNDFIYARHTVVIKYKAYKKPRFIKP